MLSMPLDCSRTLVAMGQPVPQVDRTTGAPALDRTTNVPLYDVQLVMPTDDGAPLSMRVTVPQTGLTDAIDLGSKVKAAGLTMLTDVKNGKAWYMYRSNALSVVG